MTSLTLERPSYASYPDIVEPAFFTGPGYDVTLGPEVAGLCESVNYIPDPEQRLMLDLTFAYVKGGMLAASEVDLIAARQNLKTGYLKQTLLGWLFVTKESNIIYSAHEFSTARQVFRDLDALFTNYDHLRKMVRHKWSGAGNESFEMMHGGFLFFKTRTSTGGRGLSSPRLILDEGFALDAGQMGALLPLISAMHNPQVLIDSSAGREHSEVLREVRDKGRVGDDSTYYVEFCDDYEGACQDGKACDHHWSRAGCRLDDQRRWLRANPALGRRITTAAILKERRLLPAAEFARERLGWWDESSGASPFALDRWVDMADPASTIVDMSFALDISPDRGTATICVAGPSSLDEDRIHVEIPSNGLTGLIDNRRGTGWIVPRLKELRDRYALSEIAIVAGSAAEGLAPTIEQELGIDVVPVADTEVAAACGFVTDEFEAGHFVHMSQPELDNAMKATRKRMVGDKTYVWSNAHSEGDITPMYAMTLAAWAAKNREPGVIMW